MGCCKTDFPNRFTPVTPLRDQNPKKTTTCYPINSSTSDPTWDELVEALNSAK